METKTRKLTLIGLWNIWCIRHLQSTHTEKNAVVQQKLCPTRHLFYIMNFFHFAGI